MLAFLTRNTVFSLGLACIVGVFIGGQGWRSDQQWLGQHASACAVMIDLHWYEHTYGAISLAEVAALCIACPIEDMVATAARLSGEGFDVMPHFPARIIADAATLGDWIARYQGEADFKQGLILAGNPAEQRGNLACGCRA